MLRLRRSTARYRLVPADSNLKVRPVQEGEAAWLLRGESIKGVYQPLARRDDQGVISLGDGHSVDFRSREIRHRGRLIAGISLEHDLQDDAFWGGRRNANTLRYYRRTGGVYPRVEAVVRETPATAMAVVGWHSASLSSGTGLALHQLLRITLAPRPVAEVLLNLEPHYMSDWGYSVPLFVHQGRVLVYHRDRLWKIAH